MNKSLTVIVPVRKGSQRVIHKNIRPAGKYKFGLTEIKLKQLVKCNFFDEILVDTDVDEIEQIVDYIATDFDVSKIRIERRSAEFAGNSATTDDLIKYLINKVNTEHFLWTHVTSPFFTADSYGKLVDQYFDLQAPKDSLFAVDVLREFIWDDKGPVNYDRNVMRWPFTQTIKPLFLINSAAFCMATALAAKLGDRIGDNPAYYECSGLEGFDVDWADQFKIVELLLNSGYSII